MGGVNDRASWWQSGLAAFIQKAISHSRAVAATPMTKIGTFLKDRKDIIQVIGIFVAIGLSVFNFFQANLYVFDSLQIIAIGGVDAVLPREKQDRIDLNVAIVNRGTREASVLQAEIVALYREPRGGFSWVRIFPATGQGFMPLALKPGEIRIVPLITDEYAHTFFLAPAYSIPLDYESHRIVQGIRAKSMDAKGRVYNVTYLVAQDKIPKGWNGGPKEYTFDCSPHELLTNVEASVPPVPLNFNYPASCNP
jgi:hypothetical protein